MKWWGWGNPGHELKLPDAALAQLKSTFGGELEETPHVDAENIELPEPKLGRDLKERIERVVGVGNLRLDRESRILHAAGKGYPDLLKMRSGQIERAPDAVVYPGGQDEVIDLLQACSESGIAVVPFGGGTSVVGGVEPVAAGQEAVISLSLARMGRLLDLDRISQTATVGPGMLGPELERSLNSQGFTLGHFPQSFEYSSVGGWVATRSAGQASSGYGRIDELVEGVRLACPVGELTTESVPASAAGPSLKELVVGSEGVLGVITQVTLQLRPLPVSRQYEGWLFKGFEQGQEALMSIAQAGCSPDVARLSDRDEAELSMLLSGSGGLARKAGMTYVGLRGYGKGCLAIFGFEGERREVMAKKRRAASLARKGGAICLGQSVGNSWRKNRFEAPYLRDTLMDLGLLVETLETACEWSKLTQLYRAVREALVEALSNSGRRPIVMCHISHLYHTGASLYFTFLSPRARAEEHEQWWRAKSAASDAIKANGGTISHHHAVGRDHMAWMEREIGSLGIEALRSLKSRLDPAGIMNPGKLIPNLPANK